MAHHNQNAAMSIDASMNNDQSDLQETQPTTQREVLSASGSEKHLWGYLQPVTIMNGNQENKSPERLDFWKMKPAVAIGRGPDVNDFVLAGLKISKPAKGS